MEKKEREGRLDEILTGYVDILNPQGAESPAELAYLRKYADDPEALKLLRGARAVQALFDSFGDFPDLGTTKKKPQKSRSKSS